MFRRLRGHPLLLLSVMLILIMSACNLGAAPEENVETITDAPTNTPVILPSRTPPRVAINPSPTSIVFASNTPISILPPTQVALRPSATNTTSPTSIVIVSPLPGNVVAGNVQVVGSALHPNFLQYRLEYDRSDPNNIWYAVTGILQTPVLAGTLGIWSTNTGAVPDGSYQLRLRVFLRDGTQQTTQVGNIRVQNTVNTPVPTHTTVPRPIASFTQDVTSGEAPLVVRFTNLSQGLITSYSWDFGDGGSSSLENPTYTFNAPGIYTTVLRVTGPGGTANVSRQINVTSPAAPRANFNMDATSGEAPLAVTFTNTSQGQVSSYAWDFGDGTTSTSRSPAHVYNDVGTFNIIMTVTGPGGTSTAVRQVTVEDPTVPPPIANFTPSTTSGEVPLTVSFTNTTTGDAVTYLWDLDGDGVTDNTDEAPTFIYNTAGTYTVRLIAIGEGGQSTATAQIEAIAPPNAPTAGFNATPQAGDAPLTVQFTNTTTGDVTGYQWDFDTDGFVDSTETSPTYIFSAAGTYTVTLVATGPGGFTTATMLISAQTPALPPRAGFNASPEFGDAPLTVQFTNQSNGTQLTYAWDFDSDGTTDSTEQNPSYEYVNPGVYEAKLTVQDGLGRQAEARRTINVSQVVIPPPVPAFTFNPQTGRAPITISFTNVTTGQVNGYEWDFNGDGIVDSNAENPTFDYVAGGTFRITLRASGDGGANSVSADIVIEDALTAPTAAFTANPTTGTVPFNVAFTDGSQGTVDTFAWDFNGDGVTNSNEQSPTFNYTVAGNYNATLTVSNAAGSDSTSVAITASAALTAPVAAFTANPTTGTVPFNVTFTDGSQGTVDTYAWDFNGDGVTDSNEQSPTFNYTVAGNYNATLTVSNAAGSDSTSVAITASAALTAPVAAFTANPTTGTVPFNVAFTNGSQGTVDTYAWDFNGDGVTDSNEQNPTFNYTVAGNYNATLTVSNAVGSDSTSVAITASAALTAPVAAFTADPTTGTVPFSVAFTDGSQGSVDTYAWDFNGDGVTNSNEQSPTFNYTVAGNYNATLTVSNAAGSDSTSVAITASAALTAPVAAFTANPTTGTVPFSVTFTNGSQGTVDTFAWDFNGDGVTNSNEQSPTFNYTVAGNYNATLTVSNAAGSDSTSVAITASAALTAPVAAFTANPTTGTVPFSVTFTNGSQGTVDTFAWDFNGDGVTDSNEQSPTFNYTVAGNYNATLTVSNAAGSDSTSVAITANAALTAPVAAFTANPTTGTVPFSVAFTNGSQGTVDTYAWDFNGDGVTDSNEQSPTFNYTVAGNYNATLTVSNAAGSDSTSVAITASAALTAPVAAFTANPTTGTVPFNVTFTDGSQGTVDTFAWDFNGDGVTNSNEQSPTFNYTVAGNYNATLTVSNAAGSDSTSVAITANAALTAPVAAFTANPTTGTVPFSVAFTNGSQGTVDTFAWDFNGDGVTNSNEQSPTFNYTVAGNYNATLTVSNAAGSDSTSVPIVANQMVVAPVAAFTANPTTGTAPLTVTFTDASQGTVDGYEWDFDGNGSIDSNEQNPSFTYNAPGTYFPVLTVRNSAGFNTTTAQVQVNPQLSAPVAAFTANPTSGTAPLTVTFTNGSQGTIDTYAWDFNGDGITDSNEQSPSFSYSVAGNYNATLTVSNAAGSDSTSAAIVVNAALVAPVASFTTDVSTGTAPLTVTFTDASQGQVDNWEWDFNGDGVADTVGVGPHTFEYTAAGTYTVTLTVSNAAGSNSSQTSIAVADSGPALPPGRNTSLVAFVTNRDGNLEVYTMDTNGGNVTNITNNGANDGQPTWAPDGFRLAYATDRDGNLDIYAYNTNSQRTALVINLGSADTEPAWSPDGNLIAFSTNYNGNFDIYVVRPNGQNLTQLTSSAADERHPTWSPDSSRIAYSATANGDSDIYIMNSDGSGSTALVVGAGDDKEPAWSGDNRIAFASNRFGDDDIFVINPDGSGLNQLTTAVSNDYQPAWTSDNLQIFFTTDRTPSGDAGGDENIYSMNSDGGNQQAVTSDGSVERLPALQP